MKNEHIEFTSVDDLITELQEISKGGYGDYPVCINGTSPVFVSSRPYYYDGGYIVRDASKDCSDFLRSRVRDEKSGYTGMRKDVGMKDQCFDVQSLDPTWDDEATIDGRTVRNMDVETWSFLDKKEQEEAAIFNGQLVKYQFAKKYDKKYKCHPFTAYLESGESAIGASMHDAKEKLKEQFSK